MEIFKPDGAKAYSALSRDDYDHDIDCYDNDTTSLRMTELNAKDNDGQTHVQDQTINPDRDSNSNNHHSARLDTGAQGPVYCSSSRLCYVISVFMTASLTAMVCVLLFGNTTTPSKYIISGYRPPMTSISKEPLSNLVIGITDGMGPSYAALARLLKQHEYKEDLHSIYSNTSLSFDLDLIGEQGTRSYDSYITDSAAAATAISTGYRTNNMWINVLPNRTNVAPVFSAIKHQKNMHVGIVVKSTVTHATPAGFYAHTIDRANEFLIADQALDFEPDVLMGGGRMNFENRPETYYLSDKAIHNNRTLLPAFIEKGYTIVHTKEDLLASDLSAGHKILGLFANGAMGFSIDDAGENTAPDLLTMVQCAVEALEARSKVSGRPYALMVEASLVDWAGHMNDGAALAREVLEWEKVWAALKQRVQAQTLNDSGVDKRAGDSSSAPFPMRLLATSDHETGGLAIGARSLYTIDVATLANQKASFSTAMTQLAAHRWSEYPQSRDEALAYVTDIASKALGIPVSDFTDQDLNCLYSPKPPVTPDHAPSPGERSFSVDLGCVMNARVNTAYSTHGHTGADVNLYAYPPLDPIFNSLRGMVNNYDIAWWMASQWGVDMSAEQARVASIPNGSG